MNDTIYMDNWILQTYYILPYGTTGASNSGTLYNADGSIAKSGDTTYQWASGVTSSHIRQYPMYQYGENQAGSYVLQYRPRLEKMDGSEIPIETLLRCSEHRPIIDNAGTRKSIARDSKGYFTAFSNVGITNGMVGYWPLDGHVLDYSGSNNDGTVSGAISVADSYLFDGVNDYISVDNVDPTLPYTIMTFVKANVAMTAGTSSAGRKTIYNGNGAWNPGCWATAGIIRVHSDKNYVDHLIDWSDLGWHMVGQTYDGTNTYVIWDGQLITNGTYTTYAPTEPTTFVIGNESVGGTTYAFNGNIKNFKVFNRALSAKEIAIENDIFNSDKKMKIDKDGSLYISGDVIEGL